MEEQQKRLVVSILAYAAQRGLSVAQLCRLTGIDLDALKRDREIIIEPQQVETLWKEAIHLSEDPLFGLHFGESLQLSALGIVGEIIKSSPTVGDALTQAASLATRVTDLIRMEITRGKKSFTIEFVPTASGEQQQFTITFRQMLDFLMVFTIHELDGLLLERIVPNAVKYLVAINDAAEYERVLRCPVKKAKVCVLEFDNRYWQEPVISANHELQRSLLAKVQSATPGAQSLKSRIYTYLMSNSYLGIRSLEDVAANFHISSRSLQRKLQEEGTSYLELSDAVRKSLAVHYIRSGSYQLKEISGMLGYNELSAFTRAFKRWTGKAPVHYQAESAAS
ncbi:MAG TPA: AraC family transcriptional regulator ligand-binding domain-containing protein [Ohtaekwangia sp.]|uniref:AraC family transcriptional regulator n=1 Tax=Ohtaekwangia sp. TaxID=2066019 RepID=UPI002F91F99D